MHGLGSLAAAAVMSEFKRENVNSQIYPYTCQGRIQDFLLGGRQPSLEGRQPPTQALFGENICKTKEFGPVGGGARAGNFCM